MISQFRVGIVVAIRRRRRRANGVDALYGIIPGVQKLSSVGCTQKHTLGVFIESLIRIQATCVLADSNCEEQDIVLSAGGATRVARATISNQISLVQDAVGPVGPSTIV